MKQSVLPFILGVFAGIALLKGYDMYVKSSRKPSDNLKIQIGDTPVKPIK